MSTSVMAPPAGGRVPAGVDDVRDLDARAVVDAIVASRRFADAHEARVLALAVHFVDLHPVTPDRPAASWDPEAGLPVGCELAGGGAAPGAPERIAGEGTPGVAEYAVEELGAALGLSYRTALQLVADALEVCCRLPRLWALVQDGRLQAWKARQVARLTVQTSPVVAAFVDRQLVHEASRNRVPTVSRLRVLVHEALLRHDPDAAAAREEVALARRGVWFDHRDSTATTRLTATLDTLDALDLDATVSDVADQLGSLGDSSPLDVRRARALGALAQRDTMLDLAGRDEPVAGGVDTRSRPAIERPVLRPQNSTCAHVYVHLSLVDLVTAARSGGGQPRTAERPGERLGGETPTAQVERLGPATLELVRDWLGRSGRIQLRPVLHAADRGSDDDGCPAVDRHDPPDGMRETLVLRDGHCVFPGCAVDARRCDQDHVVSYVPLDDGGPPGQTSVQNLACLCRRHHRLKTHTTWRYRRLPDGDYEWRSPVGHTYLASPTSRG